ncbi:hypothetical protein GCM10009733_006160 [Nonomuraea maheshkhaliensis]|uniref:Uncharacterized protein n=1 Tax=Nonomuraea maheshkhaliensis TaxID=419590 RepID=A0ABP4QJ72_9ACTN
MVAAAANAVVRTSATQAHSGSEDTSGPTAKVTAANCSVGMSSGGRYCLLTAGDACRARCEGREPVWDDTGQNLGFGGK